MVYHFSSVIQTSLQTFDPTRWATSPALHMTNQHIKFTEYTGWPHTSIPPGTGLSTRLVIFGPFPASISACSISAYTSSKCRIRSLSWSVDPRIFADIGMMSSKVTSLLGLKSGSKVERCSAKITRQIYRTFCQIILLFWNSRLFYLGQESFEIN